MSGPQQYPRSSTPIIISSVPKTRTPSPARPAVPIPAGPASGRYQGLVTLKRINAVQFSLEGIEVPRTGEQWKKDVLDANGNVVTSNLSLSIVRSAVDLNSPNFVFQGAGLARNANVEVGMTVKCDATVAIIRMGGNQPGRVTSVTLTAR